MCRVPLLTPGSMNLCVSVLGVCACDRDRQGLGRRQREKGIDKVTHREKKITEIMLH